MNSGSIFEVLSDSEVGAYAVSVDRTVLFWNKGAQKILGYAAADVVGNSCSDVLSGLSEGSFIPECQRGCPSLRCLRDGRIPNTLKLRMLSASGDRKPVYLTPMVIGGPEAEAPVLVHILEDGTETEDPDQGPETVWEELAKSGYYIVPESATDEESVSSAPSLTSRELEILRLVSLGRQVPDISEELSISQHTVRNHIRHFRSKLKATTRLDAVVRAIRLGILELE